MEEKNDEKEKDEKRLFVDTKKKTYSSNCTRSWKNETTKTRKNDEKNKKRTSQEAKKAKNFGRVPQQIISSSAIAG